MQIDARGREARRSKPQSVRNLFICLHHATVKEAKTKDAARTLTSTHPISHVEPTLEKERGGKGRAHQQSFLLFKILSATNNNLVSTSPSTSQPPTRLINLRPNQPIPPPLPPRRRLQHITHAPIPHPAIPTQTPTQRQPVLMRALLAVFAQPLPRHHDGDRGFGD